MEMMVLSVIPDGNCGIGSPSYNPTTTATAPTHAMLKTILRVSQVQVSRTIFLKKVGLAVLEGEGRGAGLIVFDRSEVVTDASDSRSLLVVTISSSTVVVPLVCCVDKLARVLNSMSLVGESRWMCVEGVREETACVGSFSMAALQSE